MDCRVKCFCPMGDDWYSANVSIEVKAPKTIPDYCDVETFLRRKVDGKPYILEDVCARVHRFVKKQTHGKVRVRVSSSDAVHPPVLVEKSDFE